MKRLFLICATVLAFVGFTALPAAAESRGGMIIQPNGCQGRWAQLDSTPPQGISAGSREDSGACASQVKLYFYSSRLNASILIYSSFTTQPFQWATITYGVSDYYCPCTLLWSDHNFKPFSPGTTWGYRVHWHG